MDNPIRVWTIFRIVCPQPMSLASLTYVLLAACSRLEFQGTTMTLPSTVCLDSAPTSPTCFVGSSYDMLVSVTADRGSIWAVSEELSLQTTERRSVSYFGFPTRVNYN